MVTIVQLIPAAVRLALRGPAPFALRAAGPLNHARHVTCHGIHHT
jgi:hypothetical protein